MTIAYRDVSHYNGAYKPTGPTCAKATEGTSYIDPEYAGIRSRTLAGGWPFLAYHYLRTSSVTAQAAHVVDVIGHGKPIMLDVEANSGTIANVLAFMDAYKAAGGLVTLVYLPHWYWQQIGSPSLAGIKARAAGLVSSNYPSGGYTETGPGWNAYGGMTPIIWQYTSTPIDTNAFKGTQAELAQLWVNGTNPPPEVDVPLTTDDAKLVVAQLKADPDWQALIWRQAAEVANSTTVTNGPTKGEPNKLAAQLAAIAAAVNADLAVDKADAADDVTVDQIVAGIKAALPDVTGGLTVDQIEQAVRAVLTGATITPAPPVA